MRVGRDEFEVDIAQEQRDSERYDEGRGLIGGDPAKRPAHVRWRPIPEEQPYFRLIDISAEKRARLDAFLSDDGAVRNADESPGTRRPLEIEIGFGSGEFLLGRAAAHPERRFLGFEVKRDLCRSLVKRGEAVELGNLWVGDDDARWALPQLALAGQVDVVHALYPDPWWKRKHQAKRLFSQPFLDLVQALLVPGGLLHVRSDVEGYAQHIEALLEEHGGFSANDPALARPFDADPPTRREAYCRQIGRAFWVMAFAKRPS
jgi:tRNA (guanine-N7-)-methyltransferase